MRSCGFVLLLAVGCGFSPPAPTAPIAETQFEAPEPSSPVETTAELVLDVGSSWLDVTAKDRQDVSREALEVIGGRAVVQNTATGPWLESVQIDLGDVAIDPKGLPGAAVTAISVVMIPTEAGSASLSLSWSLRAASGDVRPLRGVEVPSIAFHPRLFATARGMVLSVDGSQSGALWQLEGWFEMSDLSFGLIAVEVTD